MAPCVSRTCTCCGGGATRHALARNALCHWLDNLLAPKRSAVGRASRSVRRFFVPAARRTATLYLAPLRHPYGTLGREIRERFWNPLPAAASLPSRDRKSTRLNSSH